MTDAEREAQKWVGDESKIRADHEIDREKLRIENGDACAVKIGTLGTVNPYTFGAVDILLLRLDEARAEICAIEQAEAPPGASATDRLRDAKLATCEEAAVPHHYNAPSDIFDKHLLRAFAQADAEARAKAIEEAA